MDRAYIIWKIEVSYVSSHAVFWLYYQHISKKDVHNIEKMST